MFAALHFCASEIAQLWVIAHVVRATSNAKG